MRLRVREEGRDLLSRLLSHVEPDACVPLKDPEQVQEDATGIECDGSEREAALKEAEALSLSDLVDFVTIHASPVRKPKPIR